MPQLKNLAKYLLDGFVTCEQPSEKKMEDLPTDRNQFVTILCGIDHVQPTNWGLIIRVDHLRSMS